MMVTEQLEGFPLSPQQRRLWLLQNEERTFAARVAVSLEGALRVELLQAAIGEVAGRHEILRTKFYRIAGAKFPVQVIVERTSVVLEQHDLSALGALEKERALDAHLHDAGHLPAEAARETAVRAALFKLSEESHLLSLVVPSLCADARSLANITREIGQRYGALLGDAEASGADEPLQYADLAEALNELLESEETEAGRAYWRDKDFSGADGARLPLEQPGAHEDFAPHAHGVDLAAATLARIDALTESRGVSPAAFLLACWEVLLWRLAARPEMVCGVACDGRGYEELKEAVGLFTKHLPVRFALADELPFGAVLEQVSTAMREATERQEYFAWEQMGGRSERASGGNAVPFLPQTFAYEAAPASFDAGGIRFSVIRQYACVERFTVQLCCTRTTEGLRADFHYDAHSFAQDDVRRLAGQYVKLLESALDEPEARIGELDILSEDERRQLLSVWNHSAGATMRASEAAPLHRLFEAQAERTPEAAAVIYSGAQTTYRELNRRANQLANYLIKHGVGTEARVGICLERSAEMIVALLAVMKAGGAYVPLDPESPAARLAYQIDNAGIEVLLTGANVQAHLPHFAGEVIRLDRDRELLATQPYTNPERAADPRQTAYVIYTSGSTGTPKGVAVTHGGLVNYATFIREQLLPHASAAGSQLHFATVSTISADLGNTSIFPSLISGGCLHVIGYEVATDGTRFADYFSRHPVDVLKIVPSHLSALLASHDGRAVLPRKVLILGGEPFSFELKRRIAALDGKCAVINHYGPTETTVGSLVCEDTERAVAAERWGAQTVPLGRPIANTEIYILNRSFHPVPVGVAGELHIGGAGLARGYLNQPAPTAERMIPHPFSAEAGARLYRTGDLARYLPDGQVEFLGRVDQQLKIRGFRIEPGEIESVLEAHPAVGRAVVTAREDTPGDKRLAAYVVPADASAPPPSELRHFLKQELPDHMIPSAFVVLKSLPLTANGKLDRAALPAPDQARPELEGGFVAARTRAETVLADIWAQVLGLKQIGIHDNFFELGGDSILSIQIAARANHANLRFTPIQLFQHPTIAGLAAVVGDDANTPRASGAEESIPLTPIQQRFFESDFPDAHHWNLSLLLEPGQSLDPSLLEQALQELPRHHDALRLRFSETASGWRQTISGADARIPFAQVDLSALPAAEQTRALETQAAALQTTLSLTDGMLLRAAYFDLGAGRPGRFLLVVHHLLVDITSLRILLDDLWTAYTQLARGERIELAPVSTPFKLWAERLADYARSNALRDESNYWLGAATGQAVPLPTDFPGGANTVASSRTLSLRLDEEETRVLLQDVPKANRAQVSEVLLTALALAFARWTRARSLSFDLEGHGREEIFDGLSLSRTLGWFTAIYPVRLDVEPGAKPQDALSEVKRQVRGVPRGGIGYGLLRYAGADKTVAEQLRARPAPEVSFNYWGNLDRVMSEAGAFALAPESAGANQSARAMRPHLLEVSGLVSRGRLRMDWVYSENLHRPETLERLAEDCMSGLRSFIAHARSAEARRYSPADFPRVKLDQQKLDKILGGLNSPES